MNAGKWEFQGYQERNYGKSALYADRSLTIDASSLPNGITLAWAGGDASHARVLAVYGDLTMNNVTVTGGYSAAVAAGAGNTGAAVHARPRRRDRGLGDGDADRLRARAATGPSATPRAAATAAPSAAASTRTPSILTDCVVSGNSVTGYGGSGGGVFSVGGVGTWMDSCLSRTAVTGNRVTAQHAYGGGVYSDGGGPGNMMTMNIQDCTIARNLVEDHPGIAESRDDASTTTAAAASTCPTAS